MNDQRKPSILKRVGIALLAIGPGIFCMGYTIGTGSVTSMAKAGSEFGMGLLWVLFLSCLFSWVMMEAYGRFGVITGDTTMHGFRNNLPFGKGIAIITTCGIVIAQWNALAGILGLCANAIYEGILIFIPGVAPPRYASVLLIAITLIGTMYLLVLVGKYSFFEKVLVFFVSIMAVCFIISMFIVLPPLKEIAAGFIPLIPEGEGGKLMAAAFVGTTLAAPTFVVRPLLMKGKGWGRDNTGEQSRDAFFSAGLMFIVSGAIMTAATGALYHKGVPITKVLDMVTTLEPIAGKFAVLVFLIGTIGAGLSSIFPVMIVAPLLIADYRDGELETKTPLFRILAGGACLFSLIVPLFGANPIAAQIATQVANVFVLPLVVLGMLVLINRSDLMGNHKAGILLNIGLIAVFFFSLFMSYIGFQGLGQFFRSGGV